MIVSFFIHLKNRRILSFSFCLRPPRFAKLMLQVSHHFNRRPNKASFGCWGSLCAWLHSLPRERIKKSPQRARYQTGTAKESCTQRKMSSKSFQHSFSSGERVQDQRKPEHLFLFALPRGLTGPWAQLNKARIQIRICWVGWKRPYHK